MGQWITAGIVCITLAITAVLLHHRVNDDSKMQVEANKLCDQFQMKAFRSVDNDYFCAYGVLKDDVK